MKRKNSQNQHSHRHKFAVYLCWMRNEWCAESFKISEVGTGGSGETIAPQGFLNMQPTYCLPLTGNEKPERNSEAWKHGKSECRPQKHCHQKQSQQHQKAPRDVWVRRVAASHCPFPREPLAVGRGPVGKIEMVGRHNSCWSASLMVESVAPNKSDVGRKSLWPPLLLCSARQRQNRLKVSRRMETAGLTLPGHSLARQSR